MITLGALNPVNPQAVFASFGLLRVLAEAGVAASLAWRDGLRAELHGIDLEGLGGPVLARLDTGRAELNWCDSVKGFTGYRGLMADCAHHPWLQAFWLESPDGTEETKLDMTAGAQKFFVAARAVADYLLARPMADALRRTLVEPWDYADRISGLGFDPASMRSGATITGGKSPSAAPHATMALATWLAVEAFPLFPTRWLGGKPDEIVWALPHRPVGLGQLRQMLLAAPALSDRELEAQGWSRWRSKIGRNGKFGYLHPATRLR